MTTRASGVIRLLMTAIAQMSEKIHSRLIFLKDIVDDTLIVLDYELDSRLSVDSPRSLFSGVPNMLVQQLHTDSLFCLAF